MNLFAAVMILAAGAAQGSVVHSIDAEARILGYSHSNDTTTFVFDPAVYGVERVDRVVLTGVFRAWDQNMDDPAWNLAPWGGTGGLWLLHVYNPGLERILPSSPFKFRINGGDWLTPPRTAENRQGDNLIFMYTVRLPRLTAELRGPRAVWMHLSGDSVDRPLDADAYRLVDARGETVEVEAVLPNTSSDALVVPTEPLDIHRVYYLEIDDLDMRALCRYDGWFRTLYSPKALGAEVDADAGHTTFRVFSPRADSVRLYLWAQPEGGKADTVDMTRDEDGVWEAVVSGDRHGTYYDFTVHGPVDPGNMFYETHPVHVSDPYARVNVESFGRSRVWRPTTPATRLPGGRPRMEDVVAYEVHVQDFTDRLPVSDDLKGTLPAMVEPGLRNSRGEPVGFDYLVDLGVNVVHLLPVQEYLHYPDDEWREAFQDDPYMIEQGISEENYQWGYRTTHAFAVETRYRRRGTDHGAQREQFRDLVQAFHDRGIAVIIDIVPNHTAENMDGRTFVLNFNAFDKPYYYRTNQLLEHIGPYGNETKTEDRPMVQRWVLDQCKHFIQEFGIDGFRIDLAGQIDAQTLRLLRYELGEDVIIYGEPWIAPSDPDVASHPDWAWTKADAPITFFQDEARNAFKGPVATPVDKAKDRGYSGGNGSVREDVMRGLANSFPDEHEPNRGINYLDIHDNWALADRFAIDDWDGRRGVEERPYKIAAGLLMTSLGPVVLHGGSEIMRSKGHAPLVEIVKHTRTGPIHIHGKRDTYNLRRANQFVWENVGRKPDDESPNDYANMHAYWRGLIALRNSAYGEVFRIGTAPPEGHYQWILPDNELLLGYVVGERVLVLVNVDVQSRTFRNIQLPPGQWRLVGNDVHVDHVQGILGADRLLTGGRSYDLELPSSSLKIWVRD